MEGLFLILFVGTVFLVFVLAAFLLRKKPAVKAPRPSSKSATSSSTANLPAQPKSEWARVRRVLDGDTVIVSLGRRREYILRLDGIDCPEDGQPWGDIATFGLIKMIGGKRVLVEQHGHDRYQRTLATLYVQRDGEAELTNVNARMVMLGHAWVYRQYCAHLTLEYRKELHSLERWARRKRVGLWKNPDPQPPWQWRNGAA